MTTQETSRQYIPIGKNLIEYNKGKQKFKNRQN